MDEDELGPTLFELLNVEVLEAEAPWIHILWMSISGQTCHLFRRIPATNFGANLPGVSGKTCHF